MKYLSSIAQETTLWYKIVRPLLCCYNARMHAYWNGTITDMKRIRIAPDDLGVLRGFGIYEGVKFYGGIPFMAEAHFARMKSSAKATGLPFPFTKDQFARTLALLSKKNKLSEGIARVVITGGPSENGIEQSGVPTVFITVHEAPRLPVSLYEKGGHLITHEYLRPYPLYKTTNYIEAVKLQPTRKKKKAIEILYVHSGLVLECATSNIFIVTNRRIITPKENVLPGITRLAVLKLMKGNVEERNISTEELFSADEVFMVSSFKEIVPIVSIDDTKIADGRVGPVTKDVMQKFHALTRRRGS